MSDDNAATTGSPAAGTPEGAAPAATAGNGQDYDARLRADHEFAAKMAKEHQARADRAVQEAQSLRKFRETVGDSMARAIEQIGGDAAWKHISTLDKLMSDPKFAQAYSAYQQSGNWSYGAKGQPDNGGAEPDADEYLSPEEKKIRFLEQEVANLKNEVGNYGATAGRGALQGHLNKFLESYALEPSQVELVKKRLEAAVEQMRSIGNSQSLRELNGDGGYTLARSIAMSALDDSVVHEAAERARLRKKGMLGRLATDSPNASTGRGAPPPVHKTGADALAWAREHPEDHDSY